jgi:hypothetical protein
MSYTNFIFCLQNKWQCVQRVVADTAPFFAPREEAICTHFLPSLLVIPSTEIDGKNCAANAWLSVFPNRLNGTSLLADEWRDKVCLRYNHSPLYMPAACNGCGAKMTVEHALLCKMEGLVHI